MRLTKSADIFSSMGEKIGTLDRVVLDPGTKEITHLVAEKGLFFTVRKVIPIELVNREVDERIVLNKTKEELNNLSDFEATHYVNFGQEAASADTVDAEAIYWYPPTYITWWRPGEGYMGYPEPQFMLKKEQNIPEGTVALDEGAKVISRDDKHIGNIERILVETPNNRATHFVVSKGIFSPTLKLVPTLWITSVEDDEVRITVDADMFKALPEYQPTT